MNPTSADASATLQLPLDLLGLRAEGLAIRNAIDHEELPSTNGRVDVLVRADRQPGGGYLALHVTGTPALAC